MQKDFHFTLTYVLARKVGIGIAEAKKIAWADQYTDELKEAALYGIQSQSGNFGNWKDRQIQASVLIPFHFLPGDNLESPWIVTPNSRLARRLASTATNEFELGIALHTLQDTFSHQGFSGWEEKANACYWFGYIPIPLPNVGHTDMGYAPDIVNAEWFDPRHNKHIDNKRRARQCAAATYSILFNYAESKDMGMWGELEKELSPLYSMNYDNRRKELIKMIGNGTISFARLNKIFQPKYKKIFIQAARRHLGLVMESLK